MIPCVSIDLKKRHKHKEKYINNKRKIILGDLKMNADVYKIAKNLGLDRNEVDGIMASKYTNRSTRVSPDLYKAGTDYGTVSIKDF